MIRTLLLSLHTVLLTVLVSYGSTAPGKTEEGKNLTPFQAKNPREKFDGLIKLAKRNLKNTPDRAVSYGKQAVLLAEKDGNSDNLATALLTVATGYYYLGIDDSCESYCIRATETNLKDKTALSKKGYAYNLISIINKSKGNYSKALKYARKALEIQLQRGDMYNYACALSTTANILKKKGEYHAALDSFYRSLDIFISLKDTASQTESYNNIANLYMDTGNDTLATEYYHKAELLMKNDTSSRDYAGLMCNLGILMYNKKAYDSALVYYRKALAVYKNLNNRIEAAGIEQNTGNTFIAMKRYDEGMKYLMKAFETFKKEKRFEDVANISLDIGNAYVAMNRNKRAKKHILYAFHLSDSIQNAYIKKKSLFALYNLEFNAGKYKNALEYYRQYVHQKDSLNGIEVQNKIMELKTKFETNKKEREIIRLKEMQKAQKTRERLLLVLLVMIVIIFTLSILLIIVKRNKEKQAEMLRSENLRKENEYKSNRLATHALNMIQKNKMLKELQNELTLLEKSLGENDKKRIRKLKKDITKNINSENDWKIFKRYFEYISPAFFRTLNEKYPALTTYDIRLAALIKLNLSNTEIATVLNIAPGSVKTARHRLKVKLGLSPQNDLDRFIGMLG